LLDSVCPLPINRYLPFNHPKEALTRKGPRRVGRNGKATSGQVEQKMRPGINERKSRHLI